MGVKRLGNTINADALRVFAIIVFSILGYFLWKWIPRYFGPNAKKRIKLKGTWARNQHCRSSKEAEYFLQESFNSLHASLNLKLPPTYEGA